MVDEGKNRMLKIGIVRFFSVANLKAMGLTYYDERNERRR
jgi:hypothetical protein